MIYLKSRYGFCKEKSCFIKLIASYGGVSMHMDEGDPLDTLYLDFQKELEKVPHQKFIEKMSYVIRKSSHE